MAWPPAIPFAAGSPRQHAGELGAHRRVRMPLRRRHRLEGKGEEGIADQDRRRLVEGDMAGRLAAAEVVVIHRRQVVVNQGIGVHHLDGGGGVDGPGARHLEEAGTREHQEGPEPLAAREEGIAHRLEEPPVDAVGRVNQ